MSLISEQALLPYIIDTMEEALVLLDEELRIRFINEAAVDMMKGKSCSASPIGMYYFDYIGESPGSDSYEGAGLRKIIQTGIARRGIIRQIPSGKHVSINIVPLGKHEHMKGLLVTAQDVTNLVEMETELDMAFGLTLPNSKVEYKLKNTLEYQDEYDPKTNTITIKGIIKDGGYRHVVNSLKIFALLKTQGVCNVIGIEKDLLVQAIIYHDLGKTQPNLVIGDVIDPKATFEDGKLHAFRGAELAKHYYDQPDDIVEIIRYHHHSEDELPDTFPWRLLPMFRLFQLIDGLSAAVTRGGVQVDFSVQDAAIFVNENNDRPHFDGSWEINLYTGNRVRIG